MKSVDSKPSNQSGFSVLKSISDGSFASFGEMIACFPLWTLKTRHQMGEPLCLKLSTLYRGFFVTAAFDLPIITTQVLANDLYTSKFGKQNSQLESLTFASLGGVTSSLLATPVEQVVTVQHRNKVSLHLAYRKVVGGGYQRLMTGVAAFAIQEAGFSMCYISLIPQLLGSYNTASLSGSVKVCSSILIASIVTSIVTQPFDTIKTHQQAHFDSSTNGILRTASCIYSNAGFAGFFKGVGFRTARVVASTGIMGSILHALRPGELSF